MQTLPSIPKDRISLESSRTSMVFLQASLCRLESGGGMVLQLPETFSEMAFR